MLTEERLEALRAVAERQVKVRRVQAQTNRREYEPHHLAVALGFLFKAQLIEYDGLTVNLTQRGEHALAGSSA